VFPVLDSESGLIPVGRYNVTLDDVKMYYVDDARFATSSTRAQIWSDFEEATRGLRSVVPVVCVWIGGSFLTDKLDPDDIDLVYWCLDTEVSKVTDEKARRLLQCFALNSIRAITALRVDTHLCIWHMHPDAPNGPSPQHSEYVHLRGYWDDFWMRMRSGAKDEPAQLADALPRRGYFEVSLDGFHGI
jgi:hypothetical protein